MTQYNRVNVKLSKSQLNKLKSAIKNESDVVIRISPNIIGDCNDRTNFPHELLLLTNRQVSSMIQSGGYLGKLLGPLFYEKYINIKRNRIV